MTLWQSLKSMKSTLKVGNVGDMISLLIFWHYIKKGMWTRRMILWKSKFQLVLLHTIMPLWTNKLQLLVKYKEFKKTNVELESLDKNFPKRKNTKKQKDKKLSLSKCLCLQTQMLELPKLVSFKKLMIIWTVEKFKNKISILRIMLLRMSTSQIPN